MKKFSKEDIKRRNELALAMKIEAEAIDAAIEDFNAVVSSLYKKKIAPHVKAFNVAAVKANSFLEAKAAEAADYFADQSAEWQVSDVGEGYEDWIEELGVGVYEINEEEPVELSESGASGTAEGFADEEDLPSKPKEFRIYQPGKRGD